MSCPENDEVSGEVTGFGKSPDGDFAFVETDHYGPVTVLLNTSCWGETGGPQKGEIIVVSGLSKHKKGWRAMSARKFTLDDEV